MSESAEGFVVELARSGREIRVRPGDSILGALRDAGIDAAYSCEEGVCGACEVRLLAGIADHRDFFKSPEDHVRDGTVIICQAGCRSDRLVLDL
jgi:vanillate O-demethylase ferredoxin subunit